MTDIYNNEILQFSNYGSKGAPKNEKTRHNIDMAYKLFSIEDTCNLLGIGRSKLYTLINNKELPAVKIGSRTSIKGLDLINYIDSLSSYEGERYGF